MIPIFQTKKFTTYTLLIFVVAAGTKIIVIIILVYSETDVFSFLLSILYCLQTIAKINFYKFCLFIPIFLLFYGFEIVLGASTFKVVFL